MENTEIMKLELTRHEVLQVKLALTSLINELNRELNNGTTSDDRKAVLTSSINMWDTLKSKIKIQFDLQDNKPTKPKEKIMKTFEAYANHGCLTAEKRTIYSAFAPAGTAVTSDEIEITVPNGWELYETVCGTPCITAPWGQNYTLNEILSGNKSPYFIAYDKDGKLHKVTLEYKEFNH